MHCTGLEWTIVTVFMYVVKYIHILHPISRTLHLANVKLCPLNNSPFPSLPKLRQPPFHFLSLWVGLLQAPDTGRIIQCLFFCACLVSLSLCPEVPCCSMCQNSLLYGWLCSIAQTYHRWFVHSLMRNLGCFYLLAIVSGAAMSNHVQELVWVPAFSSFG